MAKTLIITKQYPTMATLLRAYERLGTEKEKEDLLKSLSDKSHKVVIGPALSKSIFHYLCKK